MTTTRVPEPELPDGITPGELDADARRDLRGLQKDTADIVAKHLVAAGMLVDEDPGRALEHARFARRRASRIAVVREAAGIAAYHAGEWNEALGELRAARRMGGGPGHLAVMADIERALGRPERALELVRAPEARELGRAETIELAIVAAGARRDLGELDASVIGLQIPELDPARRDPWSARLFYAYADNLLTAGRESDALQWFVHTVDADVDGVTDADARIAELTGEPLDDDGVDFGVEDELGEDETRAVGSGDDGEVEDDGEDASEVDGIGADTIAGSDSDAAGEIDNDTAAEAAGDPDAISDSVADAAGDNIADSDSDAAGDSDTDADGELTAGSVGESESHADVVSVDGTDRAEAGDVDTASAGGYVDTDSAGGDVDTASAGGYVGSAGAGGDVDTASAGGDVGASSAGGDVDSGAGVEVGAAERPGGVDDDGEVDHLDQHPAGEAGAGERAAEVAENATDGGVQDADSAGEGTGR